MNWTKCLLSLLILSTTIHASEMSSVLSIERMQLSYLDGQGAIELSKLQYSTKAFEFQGVDKKFDLSKEGPVFQLENNENRFSLGPYAGQSLERLGMLDLKDFSFFYREGQRLAFHTYHLHVEVGDGIQQISKMQWDCQSSQAQNFWAKVCWQNLKASIREIRIAQQSEKTINSFVDFLIQENQLAPQISHEAIRAPKRIENVLIQVLAGQTYMQMQAKYLFNWTLKVEGQTSITQQNDRVIFRLDRARVGILSVRSRVLDLIENAGLKNVQRRGNEIHIIL